MLGWLRRLFGGGEKEGALPRKAVELHDRGRRAGAAGQYVEALALLDEAQKLAPGWPYPSYDAGLTWLLAGDADRAFAAYEKVEGMVQGGFFFTNQTALWTLRAERDGGLPRGTYLRYLQIEWADSADKKCEIARAILTDSPDYPPALFALGKHSADKAEALAAILRCAHLDADAVTRDMSRFTLANQLVAAGRADEAAPIIRELADSPDTIPTVRVFIQMR